MRSRSFDDELKQFWQSIKLEFKAYDLNEYQGAFNEQPFKFRLTKRHTLDNSPTILIRQICPKFNIIKLPQLCCRFIQVALTMVRIMNQVPYSTVRMVAMTVAVITGRQRAQRTLVVSIVSQGCILSSVERFNVRKVKYQCILSHI